MWSFLSPRLWTPTKLEDPLATDFDFFCLFVWPPCAACGILVPQPGIEPVPPAVEARSLNHWTTLATDLIHVNHFLTPSALRGSCFSPSSFSLLIYRLLQLIPSQLPSPVPDFEAPPHLPKESQVVFVSRPELEGLSTPEKTVTVFILVTLKNGQKWWFNPFKSWLFF